MLLIRISFYLKEVFIQKLSFVQNLYTITKVTIWRINIILQSVPIKYMLTDDLNDVALVRRSQEGASLFLCSAGAKTTR